LGQSAADYLVIGIPGEKLGSVHPDCRLAGAVQLGAGWPDQGPIADPTYLLHQDTDDPYNVADQRECTTAFPYVPLWFGDPLVYPGHGEFFGFATGS
jgi:hypothetical protein